MSGATGTSAGTSAKASWVARALAHPSFAIGAGLSALVVVMALLSLVWTPYSVLDIVVTDKLKTPSFGHLLGTDHFGRDVLSMILVGAQNSLLVGFVAVGIGVLAGVALGLLASAMRGWVEEIVMRLSDFTFAFPAILSAIMITAIFGPGAVTSIIAIGIFNVPVFARLARGSANAIWAREFVLAARAAGKDRMRITFEHVLPNITSVIVVQGTISFAIAILAEAALSYLGLGTQPPWPSWGRMLNEAQTFMFMAPHLAIFPGLAIAVAVLGLNLLGDGLRDLLDPRLARQR
ncbi:MAG TPA: ABC transporter permease [Alphaproteobacteria bacterium]|nr:ABC transporter permease [Alphaproteobacteria bacterium]MDP7426581.1 ABC transporter permease [Alphaproteobacteria bacterium]HJM50839.1 ABC transporter permease [Alphaproteobacteria bacterium]